MEGELLNAILVSYGKIITELEQIKVMVKETRSKIKQVKRTENSGNCDQNMKNGDATDVHKETKKINVIEKDKNSILNQDHIIKATNSQINNKFKKSNKKSLKNEFNISNTCISKINREFREPVPEISLLDDDDTTSKNQNGINNKPGGCGLDNNKLTQDTKNTFNNTTSKIISNTQSKNNNLQLSNNKYMAWSQKKRISSSQGASKKVMKIGKEKLAKVPEIQKENAFFKLVESEMQNVL